MALVTITCAQCGADHTYDKGPGGWRKYCSERCKANAHPGKVRVYAERLCVGCGSAEVETQVGKPVCPDCRKDGRDRQGYNRARRLALYNLTVEEFDELLALQRGRCGCCGDEDPGPRGWQIDHDHDCCPGIGSCGECVRGLVCQDCNLMLGYAHDSVERLERGIKFLQVNTIKRPHPRLVVVTDGP